MDFAANFTAIDFETANRRPDSACQLAAVVVREGRVVDQTAWMIRPEPCYFSRSNIQIHGITPQQVTGEPCFGDLWPKIAEFLVGDCLVAHNASFDIGVLLACLRSHGQQVPELQFTCTRAIARRTWPNRRRYGLKPLANWLGIRFRHHDALEDSIACAKILLAAGIDREANSIEELEKQLKLSRGKAGDWGYRGPSNRRRRTKRREVAAAGQTTLPFLFPNQVGSAPAEYQADGPSEPAIDLQRLLIRGEFIRPLSGKRVVFAGRLHALSAAQAQSLTIRLGGTFQDAVDASTDVLVVGDRAAKANRDAITEAEAQAQELSAAGKNIRIVDEDRFFSLVDSTSHGE